MFLKQAREHRLNTRVECQDISERVCGYERSSAWHIRDETTPRTMQADRIAASFVSVEEGKKSSGKTNGAMGMVQQRRFLDTRVCTRLFI
jgi:hypothetical protein